MCPGAGLAENSVFVALARVVWGFEVGRVEGRTYDSFAYTDGFNIRPQRFECVIRPRSEKHEEVVRREAAEAMGVLGRFEPFGEEEGGLGEKGVEGA